MIDQALMIELGLDPKLVKKGIDELTSLLKTLDKQRALSTSQADLEIFNKKIQIVQDEISKLKNFGLEDVGNDLAKGAKSARTALTSLSLVAQDLPFGFIGIQNNLPGVIQGFGNLTTKSGGVINAFKEIGSALLGSSGLFLAFSVVTSGVTFLIKEYGSLGAGIDALFGKTFNWTKALNDAQKAQKEFAEEAKSTNEIQNDAASNYAATALKLQTLSDIVLDAANSDRIRKNALEELKELDKERFKNFSLEKGALEGLKVAVDNYTQALIANSVAKEYEQEIGKTTKNYYDQLDVLLDLQKNLDNLNSTYPNLAENARIYNEQQKEIAKSRGTLFAPVRVGDIKITRDFTNAEKKLIEEFNQLTAAISNQDSVITNDLFPNLTKLQERFKEVTAAALEFYQPKPGKADTAAQKKRLKLEQENLKNFEALLKEIQKRRDAANQTELDSYLVTLDKRNEEIYKAGQKLNEDLLNLDKAGFKNSESAREAYRIRIAEINKKYDEEELKERAKILKAANKAELDAYLATLTDRDAELFKRALKFNDDIAAVRKAGFNDLTLIEEGYRADILKINEKYDKKQQKNFEDEQRRLKKQYEEIRNVLENVFFQPLTDLFENFLNTGKFTFEEFRKTVVANIKKIIAQLVASQLINTLAQLLTPGFAGTGSFFSNLLSGNVATNRQSSSGFQRVQSVAAPNIGGISGGLALTGGVSLVLRGSDLVGSINRTNAQIQRVG
jgi:hypothetical protein